MSTKIDYSLETSIRKQRKRIAQDLCREVVMYYDSIYGGYICYKNTKRSHFKNAQLPSLNPTGTPATIISIN